MRRGDAGLTLLELVLSLAILAMVAVVSASLVDTGRRVWDRADIQSVGKDRVVAIEVFRDWLEALPSDEDELQPVALLTGSNTELRFSVSAERVGSEGVSFANVRLARNPDGELALSVETEPEDREVHVLSGPIGVLSISYYGRAANASNPSGWVPNWEASALPELIKVEMIDPEGTVLPPITVRPAKASRQRYVSRSSLFPPG